MSPMFWRLTAIYAACYLLVIGGTCLGTDSDDRSSTVGTVVCAGAIIYAVMAVLGVAG